MRRCTGRNLRDDLVRGGIEHLHGVNAREGEIERAAVGGEFGVARWFIEWNPPNDGASREIDDD